ncbi:MAG: cupredoxin domain-containing protein [Patescibacteria group bacterium]
MNKTASLIITLGLIIGIGILFIGGSKAKNASDNNPSQSVQNSEIKDGIQYITILAKGGYSPNVSTAKAGIPTKLIMKTNGTYDCSSALVIRSLDYQKVLPQNGETIIDVGIPKAGVPLQGVCSMGMYNFVVNFS